VGFDHAVFGKAAASQAASLRALYFRTAKNMNRKGIFQWNTQYPDKARILRDIEDGTLYLLEHEGRPVAAAAVNDSLEIEDDPPPETIWSQPGPARVIHRLCVDPRLQGQGLGKRLLAGIEDAALAAGVKSLCLMVLAANPFAVGLYTSFGFTVRHTYPVEDFGEFLFIEKTAGASYA
jgi:GNAT superfamily N-acetyltransferase